MTSEQAEGFSIFGRKITRSFVLVAVVMLLAAFNLYLWSLSTWHSEQFIDNVALTQNAFRNLFNEFDELMKEETLSEGRILDLEKWVEKTSIQSAKVTFLDRNHFDLWDTISDSLELFEKLLEDLRVPVRMQSINGYSIPLVGDTRDMLQAIYDDLDDVDSFIFPTDILSDGTIWEKPNYERMTNATGKLGRFSETVTMAYLIIPLITHPTAAPPEEHVRAIIVEAVGEEYFERYFEVVFAQYNEYGPEKWLTAVTYFYYIQVDDYTAKREVVLHFDKEYNLLSASGLPRKGNLMPYNITSAQAIEIASSNVTGRYVEVTAGIYYKTKLRDGQSLDLYLWIVRFYRVPRNSKSGTLTQVLVDPISGEVLSSEDVGWVSL
jgi:hypothetical protein